MHHLSRLIGRAPFRHRQNSHAAPDSALVDALGAAALFVLLFAGLHLPLFV